ncbi:hypothetical protein Tco_0635049 [Tanacetum coccineum]
MAMKPKLDADLSGEPVDQTDYRSKIGSLMYLTSSRPDIVQAVCYYTSYQAQEPTEKHLKEVRKGYLIIKGTFNMGTLVIEGFCFDLTAFSRCRLMLVCLLTRNKHFEEYKFLGDSVSQWISKKARLELHVIAEVGELFTKALSDDRFQYLSGELVVRCLTPAEIGEWILRFELETLQGDLNLPVHRLQYLYCKTGLRIPRYIKKECSDLPQRYQVYSTEIVSKLSNDAKYEMLVKEHKDARVAKDDQDVKDKDLKISDDKEHVKRQ